MELINLKDKLLNKALDSINFVFIYKDIPLVPYQYTNKIVDLQNLSIVYIDNVRDIPNADSLFSAEDNNLYVYISDELDKQPEANSNVIVICKKIADTVKKDLALDVVEFPKLEKWQLLEYIKCSCKGLNDEDAEALYELCGKDPFKIDEEIGKIKPFDQRFQQSLLRNLINEENFDAIGKMTGYQVSNALMRKDKGSIIGALRNKVSLDPMELVGILKNNLYNTIRIQMDPKATANSLAMNYKQFMAIKYNCNKYSNKELIKLYRFMADVDYNLKSGKLDLDNQTFNDYILCQFLAV